MVETRYKVTGVSYDPLHLINTIRDYDQGKEYSPMAYINDERPRGV